MGSTSKKSPQFTVLKLVQGSPEWKAERLKWMTASDMASIMGIKGAYHKRDVILKEKVTGIERPTSEYAEKFIYARGHEAEGPLRAAASEALGVELQPAVVVNETLGILASIDAVNFKRKILVEAKLSTKKEILELANQGIAWEPFRIQIITQMLVTGFREAYLFILDGTTEEAHLIQIPYCEVTAQAIIAATQVFLADAAAGRTNEIEIADPRMDRLAELLHRERDILEEIRSPMDLLSEVRGEVEYLKKAIAEELPHNRIYGSGVEISKAKPVQSLDMKALQSSGVDLRPFVKFNKPAVRVALVGSRK